MDKNVLKSGDTEIDQFHQYKRPISINNIDFNKIVASNNSALDWKLNFEFEFLEDERSIFSIK